MEDKKEFIRFLKENMRVDIKFSAHGHLGTNQFEIKITIDDEEICKDNCAIYPNQKDDRW